MLHCVSYENLKSKIRQNYQNLRFKIYCRHKNYTSENSPVENKT